MAATMAAVQTRARAEAERNKQTATAEDRAPTRVPVDTMLAHMADWEREAGAGGAPSRLGVCDWDDTRLETETAGGGLFDSLFDVGVGEDFEDIDSLLRLPSTDDVPDEVPDMAVAPADNFATLEPSPRAVMAARAAAKQQKEILVLEARPVQAKEDEKAWVWDIKLIDCGRNGFRAERVRVPAPAAAGTKEAKAAPVVVEAVPACVVEGKKGLKVAVPSTPANASGRGGSGGSGGSSPTSVFEFMLELTPEQKTRRAAALVRWRAKRKRRQYGRVVYKRRKVIANARPRKGGRFVKTSTTKWVTAAALKK